MAAMDDACGKLFSDLYQGTRSSSFPDKEQKHRNRRRGILRRERRWPLPLES
jgi:hypothetical protein